MQHLIVTYGLLAIFVLMVAESACIPVPSEVTMLLGGALAAGAVPGPHPNLITVVVAGTVGNVVGSYLAWLVGRFGGRPALHRWGRYIFLRPSEIDRAQDWFVRRGGAIGVLGATAAGGIRTVISLPPASRGGCHRPGSGFTPWQVACRGRLR